MEDKERREFLAKMRHPRLDGLMRKGRHGVPPSRCECVLTTDGMGLQGW
jgi:hypothetical protein